MSTASLHGMLWTSHWEDAGRQQKSEMLPREPVSLISGSPGLEESLYLGIYEGTHNENKLCKTKTLSM